MPAGGALLKVGRAALTGFDILRTAVLVKGGSTEVKDALQTLVKDRAHDDVLASEILEGVENSGALASQKVDFNKLEEFIKAITNKIPLSTPKGSPTPSVYEDTTAGPSGGLFTMDSLRDGVPDVHFEPSGGGGFFSNIGGCVAGGNGPKGLVLLLISATFSVICIRYF